MLPQLARLGKQGIALEHLACAPLVLDALQFSRTYTFLCNTAHFGLQGRFQRGRGDPFGGGGHQGKQLRATPHQAEGCVYAVGQLVFTHQRPRQTRTVVAIQHPSQQHQRQRVLVSGGIGGGMLQARRWVAQHQQRLFDGGTVFHAARPGLWRFLRYLACGHRTGRDAAIVTFGPTAHLGDIHIAHHHHSGVGGHVPAAVKIAHIVRGHGVQIAHPADDGATVRMHLVSGGLKRLKHARLGRFFHALTAFFFNHLDLAPERVVGPAVVGKAVGLQAHHGFEPVGGHLLVVSGHVVAGKGVVAPTQFGHPARELTLRHAGRAFEHHVLQHVCHARGAVHLVHRSHAHPQHVNGGGGTPVGLHHQRHAIGQAEGVYARSGGNDRRRHRRHHLGSGHGRPRR